MKYQMRLLILTSFIFTSTSFGAFGADLINRDNAGYEVQISSSSGTLSTSINPLVVKKNICTDVCEIKVKGVGVIKASGSETILIENGKLSKN
jgi:hypothetical protein